MTAEEQEDLEEFLHPFQDRLYLTDRINTHVLMNPLYKGSGFYTDTTTGKTLFYPSKLKNCASTSTEDIEKHEVTNDVINKSLKEMNKLAVDSKNCKSMNEVCDDVNNTMDTDFNAVFGHLDETIPIKF